MLPRGFSSFDDDPFFSGHRERMNGLMDFGMPMLTEGGSSNMGRGGQGRGGESHSVSNRHSDIFSDTMGQVQNMVGQMENSMKVDFSAKSPAEGQSYVQSSVYSYKKAGDGAPDVYEAHHSNRYAPGGIREERKALRDTRRNMEKMGVGRHIGDRGHYVEKSRNTRNNEVQEHQNLYGLTEGDVEGYKKEWHDKTKNWPQQREGGRNKLAAPSPKNRSQQKALEFQRGRPNKL